MKVTGRSLLVPALATLALSVVTSCGSAGPSYVSSTIIPPPTDGFQLAMDEFTVPAGQEVYMCQWFPLPITKESEVGGWEMKMAQGSHHLILFKVTGTPPTSRAYACNPNDISQVAGIFSGSQQPTFAYTFPTGIGMKIEPGQWAMIQSHYVNASDADITAQVDVNAHLVDPSTITSNAGTFFFDPISFKVPQGNGQSLTFTQTSPQDMMILGAQSHMHKHGITFDSVVTGTGITTPEPLVHADTWNDPAPAVLNPPLSVQSGQTFQWTCTWNNDSGAPLVYGNSALTNEMCILTGTFYPVTTTDTIFLIQ
jgi:hypothetical protein